MPDARVVWLSTRAFSHQAMLDISGDKIVLTTRPGGATLISLPAENVCVETQIFSDAPRPFYSIYETYFRLSPRVP